MRVTLLALLAGALRTLGIQLTAPARCGGSRTISHAVAKFGRRLAQTATPLPVYAVKGNGAENAIALEVMCAPLDAEKARGRIVVGLRGKCEFSRKAWHAQQAGAAGMVVVSGAEDRVLVTMKMSNGTIVPDIPSVMILFSEWKRIARCVGEVEIEMNTEGELRYREEGTRSVALNWAMARGIALWILCQCGVNVVRYKRRCVKSRERKVKVKNMPCSKWMESEEECVMCVICIEKLKIGEIVRRLECGHTYHVKCIDPWLEKMSNRCPVCKRCVHGLVG